MKNVCSEFQIEPKRQKYITLMCDHLCNQQMRIFRVIVVIDILMHCILGRLHPTKASIHTNRDGFKFMHKQKSIASTGSYAQNYSNDKWNTHFVQIVQTRMHLLWMHHNKMLDDNGVARVCVLVVLLDAYSIRPLGALKYCVTLTLEHLHSNRLVHVVALLYVHAYVSYDLIVMLSRSGKPDKVQCNIRSIQFIVWDTFDCVCVLEPTKVSFSLHH